MSNLSFLENLQKKNHATSVFWSFNIGRVFGKMRNKYSQVITHPGIITQARRCFTPFETEQFNSKPEAYFSKNTEKIDVIFDFGNKTCQKSSFFGVAAPFPLSPRDKL